MASLEELIAIVERKIAAVPRLDHRVDGSRDAYRVAVARAFEDLQCDHGAKVNDRWDGASINLGGVRSSSTSGAGGAMRNWLVAARRKAGVTP